MFTSTPSITAGTTDAEDAARFGREAEPHFDVLLRGARRLTRNDADAEDLLQDTLLNAYHGYHTFREGTNFKAWLFRIMQNRWISTHRYKQSRPIEYPVDEMPDGDLANAHCSAEAEVLDAWLEKDVQAAMDALPHGFRSVVYYADIQGHTYAETAAILDIPVGTVMSRASRARKRLRGGLSHLVPSRHEMTTSERHIA